MYETSLFLYEHSVSKCNEFIHMKTLNPALAKTTPVYAENK